MSVMARSTPLNAPATMRDDDDNPTARPRCRNSARQSLIAIRIEVGVWFIKNEQKGIAIKRTRKCDALPLPGGQGCAAFADLGLVSVGQVQNEIMDTCCLGS